MLLWKAGKLASILSHIAPLLKQHIAIFFKFVGIKSKKKKKLKTQLVSTIFSEVLDRCQTYDRQHISIIISRTLLS